MDEAKKSTAVETIEVASSHLSEKKSDESIPRLEHTVTTIESQSPRNAALYDADGNIILQPARTRDPKDPLNMTLTHKLLCCTSLCFFGALAAAAELILGAVCITLLKIPQGNQPNDS